MDTRRCFRTQLLDWSAADFPVILGMSLMPDTEDRIWTVDDRGTFRGARVPNGALGAPRYTPPTTKSTPGMPVGLARRGVVAFDPPLDSVAYVMS